MIGPLRRIHTRYVPVSTSTGHITPPRYSRGGTSLQFLWSDRRPRKLLALTSPHVEERGGWAIKAEGVCRLVLPRVRTLPRPFELREGGGGLAQGLGI